jgi:uncharacterized protein YabE (DUF348 family)
MENSSESSRFEDMELNKGEEKVTGQGTGLFLYRILR